MAATIRVDLHLQLKAEAPQEEAEMIQKKCKRDEFGEGIPFAPQLYMLP